MSAVVVFFWGGGRCPGVDVWGRYSVTVRTRRRLGGSFWTHTQRQRYFSSGGCVRSVVRPVSTTRRVRRPQVVCPAALKRAAGVVDDGGQSDYSDSSEMSGHLPHPGTYKWPGN